MPPDSSTAELEVLEGSQPTADVNTEAPPSDASQNAGPVSMLEAVQAALKPDDEGSPASEPGQTLTDPTAPEKSDELPEEVTPEELADQKPKTRKRIEQLLGQVKNLGAQAEGFKTKADNFDQMVGFVQRAGLNPDEINTGFEIMALMKSNPMAAWEKLQPIVGQLQQIVGNVIPPDLTQQVQQGFITEQHARELSRARSSAAINEARVAQTEQRQAVETHERQVQALVGTVAQSVSNWERTKAASDPDWNLKSKRINDLTKLAVMENGYPKSSDDAVKMVEKIHNDVTDELRKLNPTRRAVTPVTGSSSPRGGAAAEPKTMLEAIQMGLRAA